MTTKAIIALLVLAAITLWTASLLIIIKGSVHEKSVPPIATTTPVVRVAPSPAILPKANSTSSRTEAPPELPPTQIDVRNITILVNDQRTKAGLPALVTDVRLTLAAQLKAADMIKNGYFAHKSPQGLEAWQFIGQVDYRCAAAGENLAGPVFINGAWTDYTTAQQAIADWMASPTHRANILNPIYADTGVAVIASKHGPIIVQLFGRKSFTGANACPNSRAL